MWVKETTCHACSMLTGDSPSDAGIASRSPGVTPFCPLPFEHRPRPACLPVIRGDLRLLALLPLHHALHALHTWLHTWLRLTATRLCAA